MLISSEFYTQGCESICGAVNSELKVADCYATGYFTGYFTGL